MTLGGPRAAAPGADSGFDPKPGLDPFDDELLEEVGERSQVDVLLDELVPPDLDWRRIVRRYPIPALLVAGAAGYWLGRSKKGTAIAEALASAVALGVTHELLDADLGEPTD